MNAYELADEIDIFKPTLLNGGVSKMLRQQADRIAELEKELSLKTRDRDVFCGFTLAYVTGVKNERL